MTLHLIGLGLNNEKDISIKALEIIKSSDLVYIENYTSLLQCSLHDLAKFYDKELIIADRNTTEQGDKKIIQEAKTKEVSFLVIGDPFSATTHIQLLKLAKENQVEVKIYNNASVLTAIGITGLELYKFGKTTSIPFLDDFPQLETPYHVIKENKDMHTLCLLDIKTPQERFMSVNQAIEVLEDIESRLKENIIKEDTLAIGCARLGTENPKIKAGTIKELKQFDFGKPPHCLIIPGKLHFIEAEMVQIYRGGA